MDIQNNEAPWVPGTELRVLVDSKEVPDMDYLPCIPIPGESSVFEIPNTEWVTYLEKVHLSKTDILFKFRYNQDEVYISQSLFQYLINLPRKPAYRINRNMRRRQ